MGRNLSCSGFCRSLFVVLLLLEFRGYVRFDPYLFFLPPGP